MFASTSRLDLSVTVGPRKPGHIKTILSSHWPILIDYYHFHRHWYQRIPEDIAGSAIWRMRAALGHRDRVREISFAGSGDLFKPFFRATNHHFPVLESLVLCSHNYEPNIPATFLRGPDQSDLPLRRLQLCGTSLSSVSGLLSSATALTDLTLHVGSKVAVFDLSQLSSLLACLQGMQCLRSLDLSTPIVFQPSQSQNSTFKDIVPLLKLTRLYCSGSSMFLNSFMPGLSAPSLRDVSFVLWTEVPLLHLSRVIDDVRQEFRSISVTYDFDSFCLLSSTYSGRVDHLTPSFSLKVTGSYYAIKSINNTPSTKLAMAEELTLNFPLPKTTKWERVLPLCEFLRQFRSVRVLRVFPFMRTVGLHLRQDDEEAILPLLEEIEVSVSHIVGYSDEQHQGRVAEALAAFEPFVSARERMGRVVKVSIVPSPMW